MISCRQCQLPFPLPKFPHRCPDCGGLFGFSDPWEFALDQVETGGQGIWRYGKGIWLPEGAPQISLGEGQTPLVWLEVNGRKVGFKLEGLNPTGSFKDRGTAVLASWLLAAGVKIAVEDSSGNAGASFAAYTARAGITGRVFIPASASGPKRQQIQSFGADVVPVEGPRSQAAKAVLREAERGAAYASHAYLPQGTAGIATIAYELLESLGEAPGSILLPVGHGSLLLGVYLGFAALLRGGEISRLPALYGIQAAACSPLYQAFQRGGKKPEPVQETPTLADGVAIADPYHGREILRSVRQSGGGFLQVREREIQPGYRELARRGIHAELTSALVWDGLQQAAGKLRDPVICIISGHGLKNPSGLP